MYKILNTTETRANAQKVLEKVVGSKKDKRSKQLGVPGKDGATSQVNLP